MIGFRHYLAHMTNLRNIIFLRYKIDSNTFYSSSRFTLQNSINNVDNYFKKQLIGSISIVDSVLLKQYSNHVSIIDGTSRESIYTKRPDCLYSCTLTHKSINKRLSHFGTSTLFTSNRLISQNNYNVKQISSFSGQVNGQILGKDTTILGRLSESPPVEFTQDILVWLHSYTGLPWWATIILTTLTIRSTITLPLFIYQHYILAMVETLKYELDDLAVGIKRKTNESMLRFNWPEKYAKEVYRRAMVAQWKELVIRENCHPMKSAVLVIVQFPLWVILSLSLRNLCNMLPAANYNAYQTYLELTTGGFGWIMNLTMPDNFFILPVSLCIMNLLILEVQSMLRVKEHTRLQKAVINFLRFISVVTIPLSPYIPSSLYLYWLTSSICGLFQNLLLMSPKFRRMGGIPETESELSNPYRSLYEKMKNRFHFERIKQK